ncbi:glycosyltransferase [Pseudonocardia sp. RS11V-5]|uniref:glycosyltransferase n=1 Tax=Pseudonocardia terrae TaxID=2905831 RepID=UPI001E5B8A7D|nr:glycosyltransferase [Pseudonocardia terrae]MCE3553492.1 glycosyltransferase [Pseudonocardia terrae]
MTQVEPTERGRTALDVVDTETIPLPHVFPTAEEAPSRGGRRGPRGGHRIEWWSIAIALTVIVALICVAKALTLENFERSPVWAGYSIVVMVFIFGRFVLAWCYRPRLPPDSETFLPTVAIVVPAYNEEGAISATLEACLGINYPADKFQVVVVDDCSTDATLARIRETQRRFPELLVVPGRVNRGKRHVMAEGMKYVPDADILVFIDSDSLVRNDAIRKIVRYFADPAVGAVCGHTDVLNADKSLLARMQALQYFIAFNVHKSAEALFGSVTCCSGCFSAYRQAALSPIVEKWVNQQFFGQPSTYGDDRSLTNFLLRDWRVLYAPDAKALTAVPEKLPQFLRQQLRWKKSWLRETMRASRVMWRKPPIMAFFYYLSVALPFFAPQVVFHALVISPYFLWTPPVWYLGGIAAIALFYGLYYRMKTRDPAWYRGIFFSIFYTVLLVWQLPYAIFTIRDSKWGTR